MRHWRGSGSTCRKRSGTNSPVLKALNDRLTENRTQFEAQDAALRNEITTRTRAKRKLEKEIETLEKAKSHPYREIGRVLADCKIAPMNQPHALENVHAQRLYIDALELALVKSFAESRSLSQEAILMSWQWWVALAGGLTMLWILIWVIWQVVHFVFFRH